MRRWDGQSLAGDILTDLAGGMMAAAGIYNFALHAEFPVTGFSGIAIALHHVWNIPVGLGILLLNIPVSLICYRLLGKRFFFRSVKSMLILTTLLDYVAPLFPVYTGDRLLAAVCMGLLSGSGYAMIYMRGSSTGGQDFITMSIRKWKPHISIGTIVFYLDVAVILLGSLLVFREVDGFLYGLLAVWIATTVIDRIMYGVYKGKMALIITEQGQSVVKEIGEFVRRGTTVIKGAGGFSGRRKDIILCACSKKEMYQLKKKVKGIDPSAFTIIVESDEVMGLGFRAGSMN